MNSPYNGLSYKYSLLYTTHSENTANITEARNNYNEEGDNASYSDLIYLFLSLERKKNSKNCDEYKINCISNRIYIYTNTDITHIS